MRTITVAGKEIELFERPKHRAVQNVQNVMTSWLMDKVDISKINPNKKLEEAIVQAMAGDKTLAIDLATMQRTLPFDQTIMLATGMSYRELSEFKEDLYEDEYRELYKASKKAIGGTAEDFFEIYDSGTSGKMKTMIGPLGKSESVTSTSPPDTS